MPIRLFPSLHREHFHGVSDSIKIVRKVGREQNVEEGEGGDNLKFPFKWPLLVDKSEGEHSLFPKEPKTFPKSCGEQSKYISYFEQLLHRKVLFLSRLETKSQFSEITRWEFEERLKSFFELPPCWIQPIKSVVDTCP